MKRAALLMTTSLLILSAGKCDDASTPATGTKGGDCYTNLTCDVGLQCIDDQCVPSTNGGGDTNGNENSNGPNLEDTIKETSEILCDRLIVCIGQDNVVDDCEDQLERAFTNDGCKNFDAEQADPCLSCLEDDLDCTEVNAIIIYGYPIGTYCGVCDLMCD